LLLVTSDYIRYAHSMMLSFFWNTELCKFHMFNIIVSEVFRLKVHQTAKKHLNKFYQLLRLLTVIKIFVLIFQVVKWYLFQLTSALAHCHEHGIIHR
jgi:serine/threonine protein kinase